MGLNWDKGLAFREKIRFMFGMKAKILGLSFEGGGRDRERERERERERY